MFRDAKIVGNIIIILGILTLLFGIVTIIGLGTIFSVTGQGQTAIRPILNLFSLAAGAPIVLGSFLVMGFGELIILVAHIAEKK
jgi:hypothetical protein